MNQSYDLPFRPKSSSERTSQSGGESSRGRRSMSPDTANNSSDRRYRSRSPLRAMSPSSGRASPSPSEINSQSGRLQNLRQDIESYGASLNEAMSSEPAMEHQTSDLPSTTVSPTNASSPTPPEPSPLSHKKHRILAYENLLRENLRRKVINDEALQKARAKLDEAFHRYTNYEAEFGYLTRLVNFRLRDRERWNRARRSFARNEELTASWERLMLLRGRAMHRRDVALTRWLRADARANASNDAFLNTQADADTAWEALVRTGSGAGSTDG
ncbi:hypothetical protein sscle_07g058200 [Sclerotinia sclerotiorum 1980 UF-70]|uniref:Uncharacterized protein n=1 Tax=Sclerotinia sclerotiorum (strain ATCC 18683 / 1980 / Ss-1) TaxID=665079 RepID=A0A1D9Q7U5_SCLS1|nr:hypothetical protein sscle_07g058200 [Sclerotinia sclerotiorum 1980 UF-70]